MKKAKQALPSNIVSIKGHQVDISHKDIKGKDIEALRKLNIFSNLEGEEAEAAYAELHAAMNPKKEDEQE